MSRISRYQDSMSKFIKNRSHISTLEGNMRLHIYDLLKNSDNIVPIIMLTVLNSQSKKNGYSLHGYYMGCGMEMIITIIKILDNKIYYRESYDEKTIQKIIFRLSSIINICLVQNIEYIQNMFPKEKVIKISCFASKLVNSKISDICDEDVLDTSKNIKKTDLLKYTFKQTKTPNATISSLKQIKIESMEKYIEKKYGSMCQIAMTLGWLLGSGDEKTIPQLEKLGKYLGTMLKISYDFENIERDLCHNDKSTHNYIVNYGIQDGFELFIDNKVKFVEGCMNLDIYTNTMKEVLDLIEEKVDLFIDSTNPELKSQYTLSSNSVNN